MARLRWHTFVLRASVASPKQAYARENRTCQNSFSGKQKKKCAIILAILFAERFPKTFSFETCLIYHRQIRHLI